jgi:intermediate peptidase
MSPAPLHDNQYVYYDAVHMRFIRLRDNWKLDKWFLIETRSRAKFFRLLQCLFSLAKNPDPRESRAPAAEIRASRRRIAEYLTSRPRESCQLLHHRTKTMLKVLRRQRWTCPRCFQARRYNSSHIIAPATTRAAPLAAFPASFGADSNEHDDRVLRRVFDSKPFWTEFSQKAQQKTGLPATGLIKNRYLAQPEGFITYAKDVMRQCSILVQKTLTVDTVEGYKGLSRDLDKLSDLLCRVIDLADFIRSTHPDRHFKRAATAAYTMMFEYMNQLNTTTGLNDQLKKAASIPEVYESWTEEERTVAKILIKDFSKSAIELPDKERNEFVTISNDIAEVGTEFVSWMEPAKNLVTFPSKQLTGLDPLFIKNVSKWGIATIPSIGSMAATVVSNAEDPDIRREVYMASRTASKATVDRLERLLKRRSDLAKLAGYESFAHMSLQDKMAKTPEAVNDFLQALKVDIQPVVQQELDELLELKASDAYHENFPSRINAWDKDYYVHRLMSNLYTRIRSLDSLSEFFSLGTVFQGLSRLFNRTYGVRLVPKETLPGETWHAEVRRLDVVDDTGSCVAVVYCDLFSRPGKTPNPAHFTLRCSRAIPPDELAEYGANGNSLDDAINAATEGLSYRVDEQTSTVYQLPTIALVCDFDHPSTVGFTGVEKPTLLPLRDVQTLFHEMGHALHSFLGRTALQNVSGTRCATDLAEVPSVLMEHFAFAPQVLDLWARHYQSDKPLPFALVQERLRLERQMQGVETESQIMLAMLDQTLHSRLWNGKDLNSTAIYHQVSSQTSLPDPPGTAWQGLFGHLYGYGATYYSYLFARAVAARVWTSVFEKGERAIDREAGERVKQEFLKWGGARDGWSCVAGMLQDERLAAGDQDAMRIVGKWGLRSELEHAAVL